MERPEVLRANIGQGVLLPVGPDILDRVEFRSITRQIFDAQPWAILIDEVSRDLALVRRQPIPYEGQRSWDVEQQRCQKLHHLGTLDRPLVKTEVEVIEGQAGDSRHFVPVEVVLQDGGLAARRPSPHPMRPLAHSAFIEEDDGTAFRPGFFLIPGQLTRFHWRIASSFRSRARPSGRWQLQPRPSSTFQTWPGWY